MTTLLPLKKAVPPVNALSSAKLLSPDKGALFVKNSFYKI